MQLEDIEENKEKFWPEPNPSRTEGETRGRSESLEVAPAHKPEARRGSHLLAAAGIDFEKRRMKSVGSVSGGSGGPGESRIFQDGGQWMEEKDGKVTKLELVEVKEKMGRMRRAVPILPISLAIFLCILNVVLPSIGTFIGAGTLLCGAKCRHEAKSRGIKYGILAGFLQILLTPLLVGWIFSIYYGANMVQDALSKGVDAKEKTTEENQQVP